MSQEIILLALSVIIPFNLFLMKQVTDIKKTLAKLCERITREETKSKIYHESHDLQDK